MTAEERENLIAYRLDQARHALVQADLLAAGGEWSGVANRAYYAMFYASLALLLRRGLSARKHSGVLALIDREFARDGVLPREHATNLREAFRLRQRSDYLDVAPTPVEQAREVMVNARAFVSAAEALLPPIPPVSAEDEGERHRS